MALINSLGCPLYGITAKRSMSNVSFDDSDNDIITEPVYREDELFEEGWELEEIEGLDLIIDPEHDRDRVFSTVLDMRTGEVILLRQGIGPWPV
jgi:tRNA A37 threonylcarbamoyladenosine synthetase subunit TsaC/SUA5/YrdC